MQDYYSITKEEFGNIRSGMKFKIVETLEDLNGHFAREVVDLIKENDKQGRKTRVILPVGPLDYKVLAKLCNQEAVSCRNLIIFMMDEYCFEDGTAVPVTHPLSFHGYMEREFLSPLDDEKRPLPEHIIFPDPENVSLAGQRIEEFGGIDVGYGGFGINGHFAFNEPPARNESLDLESFKNSTTGVVTLTPQSMTQMAMGGTAGNMEMIPPKGVTLGMRELLSAKELHLYFMRTWHAGVMRRALFGPVTPEFPGSLTQTHPNVTVTMTSYVAEPPLLNVTQNIGA